ncbi:MAG: cob(I)yrinic acid a,c-diamide adenosyltransferase [Bacillota bacterium]
MGKRLTKIYTKTGDDGTTGLGDGQRVPKDDLRIEAMGAVDELNAHVGRILARDVPIAVRTTLENVQHDLFELGAELCLPGVTRIEARHVERLEKELDAFNRDLPGLKEFILPGGAPAAADAHVARTVCRRAERIAVALGKRDQPRDDARRYLNRLSDLLFVLSRVLNRAAGKPDVLWEQGRNR